MQVASGRSPGLDLTRAARRRPQVLRGAPVASHLPVLLEDTPQGEPMSLLSHVGRPDEVLHRLDSGRECRT